MHQVGHQEELITAWKKLKQKEVLHRSIIEAGYCPSHFLLGNLTIIRDYEDEILREEFYLHYNTLTQKLLLRSFLIPYSGSVTIKIERCGHQDLVVCLSEKESIGIS